MSLSDKSQIRQLAHARGKVVANDFPAWFESQCQRLLEHAIQASGVERKLTVTGTKDFLRAIGKGL